MAQPRSLHRAALVTINGVQYATYRNPGYNVRALLPKLGYEPGKNIPFRDRYRLPLRGEAINTFNHPNFGTPNATITNTATVGTITSISSPPAASARTIEYVVKFNF